MIYPKVGILYLTFATPEWQRDIDRALTSLEHISYPKERVELICIESLSSAGHVKPWFEERWLPKSGQTLPSITYIWNDAVKGFSENNNIGFAKAKELGCDYIFLLNEDAEVDPGFLEPLVARAEADEKIAYVQSLLLLGHDKQRVNSVGNAYHYLGLGYCEGYLWTREKAELILEEKKKMNPDLEIGYFSGAAVLGRVSAIDKCGLFDPAFFLYHEDTDASLQARLRGYKVVIEPTSIVYHYYEFVKTQVKKNYLIERNRWVLVLSLYRWWTLCLILPMMIVMEIGQFGFSLVRGWWCEKWRVYRDLCSPSFWRWIHDRRRRIQKERTIDDKVLLSHAVCTIDFQGEDVKNPVLTYFGNPLMCAYWSIVKMLI